MSDSEEPLAQEGNALLKVLQQAETAAAEAASGLSAYAEFRVDSAEDFNELPPDLYKQFREELKLYKTLPRPPTLGSLSFLLPKGGSLLKELFEDNWSSTCLTYAAVAELLKEISDRLNAKELKANDNIVLLARKALLTASNAPKRSLSYYKYLAQRSAIRTAQKPGIKKGEVLSATETKQIQTTLDTASKLRKAIHTNTKKKNNFYANLYGGGWNSTRRGT